MYHERHSADETPRQKCPTPALVCGAALPRPPITISSRRLGDSSVAHTSGRRHIPASLLPEDAPYGVSKPLPSSLMLSLSARPSHWPNPSHVADACSLHRYSLSKHVEQWREENQPNVPVPALILCRSIQVSVCRLPSAVLHLIVRILCRPPSVSLLLALSLP